MHPTGPTPAVLPGHADDPEPGIVAAVDAGAAVQLDRGVTLVENLPTLRPWIGRAEYSEIFPGFVGTSMTIRHYGRGCRSSTMARGSVHEYRGGFTSGGEHDGQQTEEYRGGNSAYQGVHGVRAGWSGFSLGLAVALVAGAAEGQVAPRIVQLDAIACRELQALPGEQRDRLLISSPAASASS